MNIGEFWTIIGTCAVHPTNRDKVLVGELTRLPLAEVLSFQRHFIELRHIAYRWDLWGAAYLLENGCGDDGFLDFRSGLISLGQSKFEMALRDPDSLSAYWGLSICHEGFGYAAYDAYKAITGRDIFRDQPRLPVIQEIFIEGLDGHGMANQWDFEDVAECRRRLPKLGALRFDNVNS